MSDNERERALYEALTAGDTDEIDKSRGQAEDEEAWQQDYDNAWARYQADNELSEQHRERLTADRVKEENHEAMEGL